MTTSGRSALTSAKVFVNGAKGKLNMTLSNVTFPVSFSDVARAMISLILLHPHHAKQCVSWILFCQCIA